MNSSFIQLLCDLNGLSTAECMPKVPRFGGNDPNDGFAVGLQIQQ
jgi:hypothetical protein